MKLQTLTDRYIAWRRLHGAVFRYEAGILEKFASRFDSDIDCEEVGHAATAGFLDEAGSSAHARADRYRTLTGFFRYVASRGHISHPPMPPRESEPKLPKPRPPHVYSHEQIVKLFGTIRDSRKKATKLDESTFRTLLLLLYGTGMRVGEALRLTIADVDLNEAAVTVRKTKFNKSRIVPLGAQLCEAMRSYAEQRVRRNLPEQIESSFFACLDGMPLRYGTVKSAFEKLLAEAQIHSAGEGFRNPNLHAFRHTFATNRVISWYRDGADLKRLLPALSTCLGHASLEGTRVYLSMTPELLHEASCRFDDWVNGGGHE